MMRSTTGQATAPGACVGCGESDHRGDVLVRHGATGANAAATCGKSVSETP